MKAYCSVHEVEVTGYSHQVDFILIEGGGRTPGSWTAILDCGCELIDYQLRFEKYADRENASLVTMVNYLGYPVITWIEIEAPWNAEREK